MLISQLQCERLKCNPAQQKGKEDKICSPPVEIYRRFSDAGFTSGSVSREKYV